MNEFFYNILGFSNLVDAFFKIFSIYGIYAFIKDWMRVTVRLSIGSFKIRKKYYDVQNITNIVSANFYDGGQVPADVRKEIIELTCPKIRRIEDKEE